jgi:hypothetical protein
LFKAIRDTNAAVRSSACWAYGAYADIGDDAPAELIAALYDSNSSEGRIEVRCAAAYALGGPWRNQSELLTPMMKALVTQELPGQAPSYLYQALGKSTQYGLPPDLVPWVMKSLDHGEAFPVSELLPGFLASASPEQSRLMAKSLAGLARSEIRAGGQHHAGTEVLLTCLAHTPETAALLGPLADLARAQIKGGKVYWAVDLLCHRVPGSPEPASLKGPLAQLAATQIREGKDFWAAKLLAQLAPDSDEVASLILPLCRQALAEIRARTELKALSVLVNEGQFIDAARKSPELAVLAIPLAELLEHDAREELRLLERMNALAEDDQAPQSESDAVLQEIARLQDRRELVVIALMNLGRHARSAEPLLRKLKVEMISHLDLISRIEPILENIQISDTPPTVVPENTSDEP